MKEIFDSVIAEKKKEENKGWGAAYFFLRDKIENLLEEHNITFMEFPAYIDNARTRAGAAREFLSQMDQLSGEAKDDCVEDIVRATVLSNKSIITALIDRAQAGHSKTAIADVYIDRDSGLEKRYYSESEKSQDANRLHIVFKYDDEKQNLAVLIKDDKTGKAYPKKFNFEMAEFVEDFKENKLSQTE